MRIGELRDALTIERPPQEKDSVGEKSGDWETIVSAWGNVQQLRGDEILTSQQIYGKVNVLVIIRYSEDVDVRCRVNFEGRFLSVVAVVDPDGFKRFLHLFCQEGD